MEPRLHRSHWHLFEGRDLVERTGVQLRQHEDAPQLVGEPLQLGLEEGVQLRAFHPVGRGSFRARHQEPRVERHQLKGRFALPAEEPAVRHRVHPGRQLRRAAWIEAREHLEQMGEDVVDLIFRFVPAPSATHERGDGRPDFAQKRRLRRRVALLRA